jgi:arylsulfatase A-like enzyme
MAHEGAQVQAPVSLIDVYPTLLDLCEIDVHITKNEKGHELDGHSMRPLLENPSADGWGGAIAALTVVYAGNEYKEDPSMQHYSIRTNRYRYILYNNGLEELYDHQIDPNEWDNLEYSQPQILSQMRNQLKYMVAPIQLNGFLIINKK